MNPLLESLKVINNQFGSEQALDLICDLSDEAIYKLENLKAIKDFLDYFFQSSGVPLPLVDRVLASDAPLQKQKDKILEIMSRLPDEWIDYIKNAPELDPSFCLCSSDIPCHFKQNQAIFENRFFVKPNALNRMISPNYAIVPQEMVVNQNEIPQLPKHLLLNLRMEVLEGDCSYFKLVLTRKYAEIRTYLKNENNEFHFGKIFNNLACPLVASSALSLEPNLPSKYLLKFDLIQFSERDPQVPQYTTGYIKLPSEIKLLFNGKQYYLENRILILK